MGVSNSGGRPGFPLSPYQIRRCDTSSRTDVTKLAITLTALTETRQLKMKTESPILRMSSLNIGRDRPKKIHCFFTFLHTGFKAEMRKEMSFVQTELSSQDVRSVALILPLARFSTEATSAPDLSPLYKRPKLNSVV